MRRAIVIGCPGSGKSVFSRALHGITNLPLVHLDMLYWNADGTPVPREVFDARLAEVLSHDEWIIDGNFNRTMEMRINACDCVFFLDYPTEVCVSGVLDRRGKKRDDLPWVEPDTIDEDFMRTVREYQMNSRPTVLERIAKYPDKEIHIFTDRAEAARYLEALR